MGPNRLEEISHLVGLTVTTDVTVISDPTLFRETACSVSTAYCDLGPCTIS